MIYGHMTHRTWLGMVYGLAERRTVSEIWLPKLLPRRRRVAWAPQSSDICSPRAVMVSQSDVLRLARCMCYMLTDFSFRAHSGCAG